MEAYFYILVAIAVGCGVVVIIHRWKAEPYIISQEIIKRGRVEIKTVLIVDDDKVSRELIREELVPFVSKIDEAETSRQAIDFINKNSYDLIFLDMKLYGSNGGTVLNSISDEARKKTIVVTAYANEYVRQITEGYEVPSIDKIDLSRHIKLYQNVFIKHA